MDSVIPGVANSTAIAAFGNLQLMYGFPTFLGQDRV